MLWLSGKCVYLSGLIPEPLNAAHDAELMQYGIGFTSIVARTTRGSADLTRYCTTSSLIAVQENCGLKR